MSTVSAYSSGKALLAEVRPAVLALDRARQDALDPAHIFKPGKVAGE